MNKPPAFQFYPKDWLSSAHVGLMTLEQQGAYFRLLCYEWLEPDCGLPNDDEELAAHSGLGDRWEDNKKPILACFRTHDERLFNNRLLEEREKQERRRAQNKVAGEKSGEARRQKQDVIPNTRSTDVEQVLNPSFASPSPSSSPSSSATSSSKDDGGAFADGESLASREKKIISSLDELGRTREGKKVQRFFQELHGRHPDSLIERYLNDLNWAERKAKGTRYVMEYLQRVWTNMAERQLREDLAKEQRTSSDGEGEHE